MAHPLVEQLRFTRREWLRGLEDVTPEDAARHFGPINTLSWMIGHLAAQEQRYWLQRPQGITITPVVEQCGFGKPACSPPLEEMWAAWHAITQATDSYLDLAHDRDTANLYSGRWQAASRNHRHADAASHHDYWFHLGELQAVRQMLGHTDLPVFIGRIPAFEPA